MQNTPETIQVCWENRNYLGRTVRFLAEEHGIRQFIDIGSGLPTRENVHEVAQRHQPDARVVYVDNDPIVLAHGRAILADNPHTTVITADVRQPAAILGAEETRQLIDFDEPVALMMISLLHCIPDEDDPFGIVATLLDALPSGSWLAASHVVSHVPAEAERFTNELKATGAEWGRARSPEEAAAMFTGLEIADPGLVEISTWREGEPADRLADPEKMIWEFGGVARKP
ncbi:O-methyltransferase involved in polyketide biosynthesis [Spinactinospora alkalitolerans]|uniref:O-methyltransferase involved in polyketide biosynthesis n=1 Tax=Spinactinospora alkalitolerans TaxID=687207 RepID=A0A852U767_9ACTN|nr:SAM-dependent methyltransferase [Spinactinospora alkalitolerans]NYE50713.1 O-methyltransferase involved in polyketide biosynthesis [Spinactinospora alkalitolerans]